MKSSVDKEQWNNPIENLNFIDLAKQQLGIRANIEQALQRVLSHGNYIMGEEVKELEQELSQYLGIKHAITCANGTDALQLVLRAKGVGAGDVVFVPSFTFAATAEVVKLVGAIPCFIDSNRDTYNICINSLKSGIEKVKKQGLTAKCIITVDLFGRPCDYDQINKIAKENNLWVLSDSAQGFGSEYKNKKTVQSAFVSTTSFFPAKPLGCYGDGGAVFTNDDELAAIVKSLRIHGKGTDKYDNIRVGTNSRLDTMQAAVLLEKLKVFPQELEHRQKVAECYNRLLDGVVITPNIDKNYKSAWAQYTVVLPESVNREDMMAHLKSQGVPAMVYYIKPLHLQTAYQDALKADDRLAITESLANRVLSFPMDGYLSLETVELICYKVKSYLECVA